MRTPSLCVIWPTDRVADHARIATQMFLPVQNSDRFRPLSAPIEGVSWAQLQPGWSNKCRYSDRGERLARWSARQIQPTRDLRLGCSSMFGSLTNSDFFALGQ